MLLLNIAAVSCFLASCLQGSSAADVPCTPAHSPVFCQVSEETDECSQNDKRVAIPVFSKVVNDSAVVFREHGKNYNSANISWNSPSPSDLNDTTGYELLVYHHNDEYPEGRAAALCRVLHVSSNKTSISSADAAVFFTYTVERLASNNDLYSYEIYTLPHTTPEPSRFSSSYFMSSSTVTPTPLSYKEVMNLTATPQKGYRITGGFRRASHYDSLRDQVKFHHYRVLLLNPQSGAIVKDFLNGSSIEADNIPADGDEYATFTLDGVPPGTYNVQVRPFSWCGEVPKTCVSAPVESEYGDITDLTVKGLDYVPERPKLSISSSNEVLVRYKVAPKLHYISHYILNFRAEDGGEVNINRKDHPVARDYWYWESYTLNLGNVFQPGKSIIVEVIPQLTSGLCSARGYCNIDGTCETCSPSISLGESIPNPDGPSTEGPPLDKTVWIVVGVLASLILLLVPVLIVVCRRRKEHTPAFRFLPLCLFPRSGDYMAPSPEGKFMVGGDKVTICIARTADLSPEYRNFDLILRSVLEQYFNAEVILYTGDLSDEKTYKNCDYVVVLYSPTLLITYCFFLRNPEEVPKEQRRDKAVLDLLLNPQPASAPAVLFVAFDNVSRRNVNDLVSKNSSLRVFTFPEDIRRFLMELHHEGSNNTLKESMAYYEEGPLKGQFLDAVDKVTSITDSGLGGDFADDAKTIRTVDQHDDRIGVSVPITVTPMAFEQQYLADRQESSEAKAPSAPPSHLQPTSAPEYSNVPFPPSVPWPQHTVKDETKDYAAAVPYDAADADSENRRGSNDLHSLPSSEDSFRCSVLTPSVLAGSIQASSERRETIEC